jgi:hypothetical protein
MPILDTAKLHNQRLLVFRSMLKPQQIAEEHADGFEQRGGAIERDLVHFLTKVDETMTSRTLTREGQVNTLVTLASNHIAEIQKAHSFVRTKLTDQLAAERASALRRTPSTEDAGVRYLRQRDIIDYYGGLDSTKQRIAVNEAVREHDVEFLDALMTAPRYRRTFDTAPIAEAREQLAAETNPAIGKLSALLNAYDRVYQTAQTVIREVAAQAGVTQLPPTKT